MQANTRHNVYQHPDGRREIIKNGFSWPAFLLGPLWAWRKGMGLLGLQLLAVGLFLPFVPVIFVDLFEEAGILVDLIVTLSVLTWIGAHGNAWLRRSVLDRGFELLQESTPAGRGAHAGIDPLDPMASRRR